MTPYTNIFLQHLARPFTTLPYFHILLAQNPCVSQSQKVRVFSDLFWAKCSAPNTQCPAGFPGTGVHIPKPLLPTASPWPSSFPVFAICSLPWPSSLDVVCCSLFAFNNRAWQSHLSPNNNNNKNPSQEELKKALELTFQGLPDSVKQVGTIFWKHKVGVTSSGPSRLLRNTGHCFCVCYWTKWRSVSEQLKQFMGATPASHKCVSSSPNHETSKPVLCWYAWEISRRWLQCLGPGHPWGKPWWSSRLLASLTWPSPSHQISWAWIRRWKISDPSLPHHSSAC